MGLNASLLMLVCHQLKILNDGKLINVFIRSTTLRRSSDLDTRYFAGSFIQKCRRKQHPLLFSHSKISSGYCTETDGVCVGGGSRETRFNDKFTVTERSWRENELGETLKPKRTRQGAAQQKLRSSPAFKNSSFPSGLPQQRESSS